MRGVNAANMKRLDRKLRDVKLSRGVFDFGATGVKKPS